MKDYEVDMYGNAGIYLADGNTFTFQLGEGDSIFGADPVSYTHLDVYKRQMVFRIVQFSSTHSSMRYLRATRKVRSTRRCV